MGRGDTEAAVGAGVGQRRGLGEPVYRTLLFPSFPAGDPLRDTDSAEGAFGVAGTGHGDKTMMGTCL